jgi:hypothetical protein
MDTRKQPAPETDATLDDALLDQARAMQRRLGQTFDDLLKRLGVTRAEFEGQVRRLERDPVSRRELDAARYGDRTPRRGRTRSAAASPSLPRNPRALRV